jgi:hypothetical protein
VIDALAKSHRDPGFRLASNVLEAAPEIGLYYRPDILVPLVHVEHQLEGGSRVGRVLHVHAHETVLLPRIDDDLFKIFPAQILVEGKP